MLTRRQALSLIGSVTIAGALSSTAQIRSAGAAIPLRIGWQKNGVLALAKNAGALEKRLAGKVDITWSEFTSGPPLLEALGANALDFGTTGDVPPLFAQAAGGNLLYVGTYKGAPGGSAILVPKDSPIASLSDLKGKKLAFKRGSSAHNFTVKALRKGGLQITDVEAIDLPPPEAAAAFKNGAIDAWTIWDPYYAVAETDPNTRVLTTSDGIVESWGYFLGNGDFARANPEIVAEILDELAKVGAAAQKDLDGTVAALSAITGVAPEVTRVTLTRQGYDLGQVSTVSDAAVTYQQALADEFHGLGILPVALKVSNIVWRPSA